MVNQYAHEIEASLVGGLLTYPGAYEAVRDHLWAQYFFDPFLAQVYRWIEDEMMAGAEAGERLQLACLKAVSGVESGRATIAHCIARACVPLEISYAASKIAEFAEERRCQAVPTEPQGNGRDGNLR